MPNLGLASRRSVLRNVGVASAAGVVGAVAVPGVAEAATYTPVRYRGAPLLSRSTRHLVSRFSYGVTPALAARVRKQGGGGDWFDNQLAPASISDTAADALMSWWPSLARDAPELWTRQIADIEGGWEVMQDYQRWLLLRRMTTNRQLLETMTEFWQNHLHVPANGDMLFTHRVDYDTQIRARALGRFEDLLYTAITHPAMGIYLDNAVSTRRHPNENLGRELLELHTVGRGAYDEDDVKSSARILTGWVVDLRNTWDSTYSPDDHWLGPVEVMDFKRANADPDGRTLTREYLSYLARHPRTAERIARKLAVKFVTDTPPQSLVDRLASVYLANNTEIKPVLRALVGSTEFKGSIGGKVRDPNEDLVATYRVLRARVTKPPGGDNAYAANSILWQASDIGAVPFGWPRPDGQPIDNDSWSSPARLIASMDVHYVMSGRWWPKQGITYRPHRAWLPQRRIRLDKLVDHLAQQLLGTRSTARLLQACCEATALGPRTMITADHPLVRWQFPRLLTTFLDSPTHLTR
ncbi:MAG: DUF1800 domain-containing protein [Actinomycetota bacterium]|nr:DUF1800 domain-containing protein [Actinomycetota bacterium]